MKKTTDRQKNAQGLKNSCLWGILLFAVLIFIDQITKAAAAAFLTPSESIPIVKGWLELRIVYNRGISYGLGDDASPAIKIAVIAATGVMMLVIAVLYFKVKKDIDPEHNQGMEVVPQILTNQPDDFISIVNQLKQYGYDEVNLNLGCPSGTVVAKNRGAGFLAVPDELDSFLDKIFNACDCKISIKTRVGKDSPDEWENLLAIYEKYPLSELIVHPRIQKDFYKYTPRMETYQYAAEHSRHSLCFNGDIHSVGAYGRLRQTFPETEKVMLGRGILQDPGLVGELRMVEAQFAAKDTGTPVGNKKCNVVDKQTLRAFHDDICDGYKGVMSGDRNTLFKMKELWCYMSKSFTNPEKYLKKIKKTERLAEYYVIVDTLFREQELQQEWS